MPLTWETIIGLEVHVELLTRSKIFCGCSTLFGREPNTSICPVCLGLPGSLPVTNKRAVELALKAALALKCQVAGFSKFDRKNYFYPDLPKAYQISQYDLPLAEKGYLELEEKKGPTRIGINRLHLEEDAGKLVHAEDKSCSLVDYNRCGVPLIEIVTEPDLRSPEEARYFLEKMKNILRYTKVSDCKMEQGSLRCDANISLKPVGNTKLGVKTEIKNLNSFKSLYRALTFEIARQKEILKKGGRIVQETRRWVEDEQLTVTMRSKEDAHDYRYFPEPDLAPLVIEDSWVDSIKKEMPELPDARKKRYIEELGLTSYDAGVITSSRELADFFEETYFLYPHAKKIANWVTGDFLRLVKETEEELDKINYSPRHMNELVRLVEEDTISVSMGKEVLEESFTKKISPQEVVEKKNLSQISSERLLADAVERIILENPGPVNDYRSGKKKALGFLVGQVMALTKGRANPRVVNELLRKKLKD